MEIGRIRQTVPVRFLSLIAMFYERSAALAHDRV